MRRYLYNKGERHGARYEVHFLRWSFFRFAAYGFPCVDAEIDIESVGICACAADAVYFLAADFILFIVGNGRSS